MSANFGFTETSTDATNSSDTLDNSDIAVSNGVKDVIRADLLDSKTETLMKEAEPSSDHDTTVDVVVQDSTDEPRVSGGELGIVMESSEKVLDEDLVNNEENECDKAGVRAHLLDSKTETLTKVEPSSDHDTSGDVVVRDSIDEARVSGDEKEIVMEKVEKNAGISSVQPSNTDIDVSNDVKIGDDLLDSKNGTTRKQELSSNHNGGGDIAVQDSIDEAKVSGDEKEIVMEDVEKFSDENVVNDEEKEGEYKVTDLVWGKVKSYPWWPGQIFDSSAATDKAKKHSNKKGFLIAYFGDQSFAWNEVSKIKPFRKSFGKMEKQSNSKGFCNAMNCALDEISRRIEFGLACSCLSKEVYDKVKTQVFVNAGIKKEASRIDGGDNFSTVASFKPVNVVQSVQDLAREHFDGYNTLEVLSVRTRLLAYYRWKGYHQLQAQDILDGSDNKLEDNLEIPLVEVDKADEVAKAASVGEKVSSKKRKLKACDSVPSKKEKRLTDVVPKGRDELDDKLEDNSEDDKVSEDTKLVSVSDKVSSKKKKLDACDSAPSKKEKRLTNVTPKGSSSVSNGENKMKKSDGKKATVENNGIKEEGENGTNDKMSSVSSPKSFFRIGDRISRIAKQLSESPSPALLKNESEKSKQVMEKTPTTYKKKKRKDRESVEEIQVEE